MTRTNLYAATLLALTFASPLYAQDATAADAATAETPALEPTAAVASDNIATPETEPPTRESEPASRPAQLQPLQTRDAAAQAPVTGTRSRFALYAAIDQRWNDAAGFDLYSDSDHSVFYGLAVGYDVVDVTDVVALAVELGWSTAGVSRSDLLGGAIGRTTLDFHQVHAAAALRWQLLPWLSPHTRLSLGVSMTEMTLRSDQDDATFTDSAAAPWLALGVGASIQTPAGALATRNGSLSSLQLGLRIEFGYTLSASAGLSLHTDDDLRVPATESSLGGLPLSGGYIHTAAFVRL